MLPKTALSVSEDPKSYKPDAKSLTAEIYKEVIKWLFDQSKPLISWVATMVGVYLMGHFAVFGSFFGKELAIKRYEVILWALIGGLIGLCFAALYSGRRMKVREEAVEKHAQGLVAAANEQAAQAQAALNNKIQELEKRALTAEEIAARDRLTGLFNLREFERKILIEAKEAFDKKQRLSIILLDVDGFKKINDNYGMPGGDSLLKQFSRSLVESSRPRDPFFRYRSGDEFAVLVLNQGADDTKAFADRLRRETESSEFEIWDKEQKRQFIKITISAGVAEMAFPLSPEPNFQKIISELESQAQGHLSEAKQHKNRVIGPKPE